MSEVEPPPVPGSLREALARTLYEHDGRGIGDALSWDGEGLEREHPGLRERYLQSADALIAGPLAGAQAASGRSEAVVEELKVLRRQRMAPERERELLEANNRMLERAGAAAAAQAAAEAALAQARREGDVAREAEAFWQRFAFDADELATQRLLAAEQARAEAERAVLRERARRERVEGALRLFADRAEVMPKEGWVSDLAGMNRDIPLWWFHAARVVLDPPDAAGTGEAD